MSNQSDKNDADLLREFSEEDSHTAFASLVERHGPMVQAVCRRVLGHHHDAEDATQAAFIVLAREAGKLRREPSVAGWLHTVARRISLNAALSRQSRLQREQAAMTDNDESHPDAGETAAFRRELDEALLRLPEHYRQPLILFHLEGASLHEVGARLHLNPSTLRNRLARAREHLRGLLRQRGVKTASASAMGTLLASQAGAAPLPPLLAANLLKAATGQLAAAPHVLLLAQQTVVPAVSTGLLSTSLFILMKSKIILTTAAVLATGFSVYLITHNEPKSENAMAETGSQNSPKSEMAAPEKKDPKPSGSTVSSKANPTKNISQEQMREEAKRQFREATMGIGKTLTNDIASRQEAKFKNRIEMLTKDLSLNDAQRSKLQSWLQNRLSKVRELDLNDRQATSEVLGALNFREMESFLATDLTENQKKSLNDLIIREQDKKANSLAMKELSVLQAAIEFEGDQYNKVFASLIDNAQLKLLNETDSNDADNLMKIALGKDTEDEYGLGIQKALKELGEKTPDQKIDVRKVIDERISAKVGTLRHLLTEKQIEQYRSYLKTKTEESYGSLLDILEDKSE